MEHNEEIEKFAKGNRISPTKSATYFPKGTLGLGNDGNVWLNEPDVNGVVRWKKTIILANYLYLSIGNNSENYFEFQFNVLEFNFTLIYEYENGINLRSSIGNKSSQDINDIYIFWQELNPIDKIKLFVKGDGVVAKLIDSEIKRLIVKLDSLIEQKNPLRNGVKKPDKTPEPKFKKGDKVKLPTTKNGQKIYSGMSNVWDDAMKNNQKYLFVGQVWDNQITLDIEPSDYGDYFSQELDNIELYEDMPKPKFRLNDLVRRLGYDDIYQIIEVDFNDTENTFDYTLKREKDDEFYSIYEDDLELAEKNPERKFNSQDKVRELGNKRVMTVSSYIYSRTAKKWKYTLTYDDNKKTAEFFENGLELAIEDEIPEPKFKVGDKVKIKGNPNEYEIVKEGFYVKELSNYKYNVKAILGGSIYEQYESDLELIEEVPEPKFKVGDFVVDDTWSFPLKITKLDSGNGQFECVQADGYNELDTLYTVPEKTKLFKKQPKFKVGDRILYPTTQNGSALGGSAKTLIDKAKAEKLGYLVVTDVTYNKYDDEVFNYWLGFQDLPNASVSFLEEECKLYESNPEPKFKIGDKVKRIDGTQVMTVVQPIYDTNINEWDYDLIFENGKENSLYESNLELANETPESKFKIGDIVKEKGASINYIVKSIATNKSGYVYICENFQDEEVVRQFVENSLELVKDMQEKTPFQQIDFLNPSTEENDVLIKGMQNYSDGLTFINSTLANVKLILKERIAYIEVLFDKVNEIIKISEPSRNIQTFSTEIRRNITNERLEEITELYIQTLAKMITKMESETPPQDCEADPSLIVSDQVKRFYDLNKNKINKLNEQFSCKIIKALVSLSDYEKCGTPSTKTLKQPKSDLLSRISQLKL